MAGPIKLKHLADSGAATNELAYYNGTSWVAASGLSYDGTDNFELSRTINGGVTVVATNQSTGTSAVASIIARNDDSKFMSCQSYSSTNTGTLAGESLANAIALNDQGTSPSKYLFSITGTGDMVFANNAIVTMRMDGATNDVSIPNGSLDVTGGGADFHGTIRAVDGSDSLQLSVTSGLATINASSGEDLRLSTGGVQSIYIDNTNGNVLIGSSGTAPSTDLHVFKSSSSSFAQLRIENDTAGTSAAAQLSLRSDSVQGTFFAGSSTNSTTQAGLSLADAILISDAFSIPSSRIMLGTNTTTDVHIFTNDTLAFTVDGSTQDVTFPNGNVGIGPNAGSPTTLLLVQENSTGITISRVQNDTAAGGALLNAVADGTRVQVAAYGTTNGTTIDSVDLSDGILVSDSGSNPASGGMMVGTLGDGNLYVVTDSTRRLTYDGDASRIALHAQLHQNAITTETPTGATETFDWDNGNTQIIDLESATGDVTLTLSNGQIGATYKLKVIQDSAVQRNLIWPASVLWPGGTAPTITATLDGEDLITLWFDGTNYYGRFDQDFQ